MALQTALKWLNKATNSSTELEYILSIDESDKNLEDYKKIFSRNFPNIKILVNDNSTAIEAINNAAKVCTGDLLIVVSDDFDCPSHWDRLLWAHLHDKQDFIVKVEDGIQNWIITIPILDRIYYNRFNYIYNPEMQHMFVDTWMTHVADLLDRKIILPLIFKHNHYITGLTPRDEINIKNDSTWAHGEKIYLEGVKNNFGLTNFCGTLKCEDTHKLYLKSKNVI